MQLDTKIQKLLDQAAEFFQNAVKEEIPLEEVFAPLLGKKISDKQLNFIQNAEKGMQILVSLCGAKFSKTYLQKQLPEVYNISIGPQKGLDLNKKLYQIYESFQNWQKELTVYFPVEHIIVTENQPVTLGPVSFWNFQDLIKDKEKSDLFNEMIQAPACSNIRTVAGYSMVADLQKTKEIGKQIVIDVLNVIQYANLLGYVQHQTPQYLLTEQSRPRQAVSFCSNESSINVLELFRVGSVLDLSLPFNENIQKKWDSCFGDEAIKIMMSSSHSPIEDRLSNAIVWYAFAEREDNKALALVYYTIAIESLLTILGSGVPTAEKISDIIAFIVGKDVIARMSIKDFCKKIYRLRSTIAHGKADNISQQDVEMQRYFSAELIKFFFSKINEFHNDEDFAKYFETLKFSLPQDLKGEA